MELRARIRPLPRRAAILAACVALLVTALAAAIAPPANAAKKKKAPVITRVAPLDVAVGETLTIGESLLFVNFFAKRPDSTRRRNRVGTGLPALSEKNS